MRHYLIYLRGISSPFSCLDRDSDKNIDDLTLRTHFLTIAPPPASPQTARLDTSASRMEMGRLLRGTVGIILTPIGHDGTAKRRVLKGGAADGGAAQVSIGQVCSVKTTSNQTRSR